MPAEDSSSHGSTGVGGSTRGTDPARRQPQPGPGEGAVSSGPSGTISAAASALAPPTVVVRDTLVQAAAEASAETVRLLAQAVEARGRAHLALTGGSGGVALADQLALVLTSLPSTVLEAVHLWFGDERFVPAQDPDRNDLLASPLTEVGIPETNVHRLAGPDAVDDLDAAAVSLTADLAACGLDRGRFDVVHVGLGPDAHVCSLFPGHPAAVTTGSPVVPVRSSPKPPPQRVSLTFEVLHRARRLMVVAGGQDKAEAVSRGLGRADVTGAPASCARGQETTWYLDAAAASGAPTEYLVG